MRASANSVSGEGGEGEGEEEGLDVRARVGGEAVLIREVDASSVLRVFVSAEGVRAGPRDLETVL